MPAPTLANHDGDQHQLVPPMIATDVRPAMHMFEYTSQVVARERENEIARAAEQRRVVLERLAASDAQPVAAARRPADRSHDVARPGPLVAALRRALRPGVRTPRPLAVGRGTMAR